MEEEKKYYDGEESCDSEQPYRTITLQVKDESYKQLKNFLHNDMKITKPELEAMLSKYVGVYMDKRFASNPDFNNRINSYAEEYLRRLLSGNAYGSPNVNSMLSKAVDKVVQETVAAKVKEQLSKISINLGG